jgi:hypothetical protein
MSTDKPGQDTPEIPSQAPPGPEIEIPRRDDPEILDPQRQTQQPEATPPEPDRPKHPVQPPTLDG